MLLLLVEVAVRSGSFNGAVLTEEDRQARNRDQSRKDGRHAADHAGARPVPEQLDDPGNDQEYRKNPQHDVHNTPPSIAVPTITRRRGRDRPRHNVG